MSDLRIIEAIKADDPSIIKQVIESGADVNQQDEQGWTPLNWAAGKGDLETVRLLVEKGADVLKVGRDQRTPYMIALAAGRVEVAKFLREIADKVGGEKTKRPERQYCKAYHLKTLRQFPTWSESKINWKKKTNGNGVDEKGDGDEVLSDDDVVFIHQDFTVTRSMWLNEDVIFNQVTPEWEEFCANVLEFKVPDDIDLIVPAENARRA
jgi:Ankyrin repeats (3 copies)